MESSLPAAQIDFSQPSTEEEGNQNEGNEEAFFSDMAAIQVMSNEGEEIEPETVKDAKLPSLAICFRQEDIKSQIKISLALTIKFAFTLGFPLWKC